MYLWWRKKHHWVPLLVSPSLSPRLNQKIELYRQRRARSTRYCGESLESLEIKLGRFTRALKFGGRELQPAPTVVICTTRRLHGEHDRNKFFTAAAGRGSPILYHYSSSGEGSRLAGSNRWAGALPGRCQLYEGTRLEFQNAIFV